MERGDGWSGSGNHYTTFWRQYDPRLGRWMSREPKPVAWESVYASFRNNPIYFADPNGYWVKGAGFFRNLFNSDNKINAQNRAKELGGDAKASKNEDGSWRVTYTSGLEVNLGDGVINLKEFHMETYNKKGNSNKFAEGIRLMENNVDDFMKSDPTGLGKVNTREGSAIHQGAKVVAGLNPLISFPNAVKVLTSEEDIYGQEASSTTDKVLAVAALVDPFSPGKMIVGGTAGDVIDAVNKVAQSANDGGLLDKLKNQKSSK